MPPAPDPTAMTSYWSRISGTGCFSMSTSHLVSKRDSEGAGWSQRPLLKTARIGAGDEERCIVLFRQVLAPDADLGVMVGQRPAHLAVQQRIRTLPDAVVGTEIPAAVIGIVNAEREIADSHRHHIIGAEIDRGIR